ncbi:flagellar biosynthesis anti-sigma factor FlgM [Xenophilus sp. AP218F]|nr:flagellar biosynthesis anti-sigma factor FlgM [Chromobacterium sp. ASV5]OWY39980.1 flagellar biosynthesis anti-sigma factor FlgM [Xenophilus sp. AP218F]
MQITPRSLLARELSASGKAQSKAEALPQPAAAAAGDGALASAAAGLQALPEVDLSRVAEVKQALARGEVQFDAQRLADLVARYHGGRE